MPGLTALHDTEAVPDAVRVAGVTGPQDISGGIVSPRLIVPENWLRAPAVIVEFEPLFTFEAPGEPAVIVKSCTTKVTTVEWERDALWPVTVTCLVSTEVKLQDRLALPELVTVASDTVQSVLLVVKLTIPEKPFNPPIVMIDVEAAPTLRTTLVGLAFTP